MKKLIGFSLILVLLFGCLSGCAFLENIGEKLTEAVDENTESPEKIDAMLLALAEGRADDAKALMHPDKADECSDAIEQMITYLDGRKVTDKKVVGLSVNIAATTNGKTRQEAINYYTTLDDGTILLVSSLYVSDNAGVGFTSFNLSIGLN